MRSTSWGPAVFALGAVIVLAGCDSNSGAGATSTSAVPSVAADVPAGFDPCEDIPQSVLDSEKLRQKINDDATGFGGIKWRGCLWAKTDAYAVSIRTTNITLDMVRAKGFADTHEFTLGNRRAISSRQSTEMPDTSCTLDVEMKGGSLEFGLSNPKSAKTTGQLDSCDLVHDLADKIVPTMPAGV